MLKDLAEGLVLELREVLPATYEIFADTQGTKDGVWVYQPTEKGPYALYAAIFMEEAVFNAQFSDNKGNEDFSYAEPSSVPMLVAHVKLRFETAGPKANLYGENYDDRRRRNLQDIHAGCFGG